MKKRWLSWSSDEDKGEEEAASGAERAVVPDALPQQDQSALSPPRTDVETLTKGQLQLPAILRRTEAASAPAQQHTVEANASEASAPAAPSAEAASKQMQLDSPDAAISSPGSSISVASTPPRSPPRLLRPPALLAHSQVTPAQRAGAQLVDFSRAPPPTAVEAPLAQMRTEERQRARETVRLEAQAAEQDMERLSMALEPVDHQSQLAALQQRVDLRDVRRADLEQVRDLHCLHGDERLLGADDGSEEVSLLCQARGNRDMWADCDTCPLRRYSTSKRTPLRQRSCYVCWSTKTTSPLSQSPSHFPCLQPCHPHCRSIRSSVVSRRKPLPTHS